MLQPGEPKWRRRKDARPAEIVEAAFEVFAEKGFAAARLDDIAARAGVSKGALYLYFDTKEALFQAVVRDRVAPNLAAVAALADQYNGPFADLARLLLPTAAQRIVSSGAAKVAKMVIGESRNFPELARFWHAEIIGPVLGIFRRRIEAAQAAGELRPGDSRNMAFALVGPLLMGMLWREVMEPIGAEPLDFERLAREHVETALGGMLARRENADA